MNPPIALRSPAARRCRAWRLALTLTLTLISAGCAPTPIVRLEGDPVQAEPLTTPLSGMHPAADGVSRFALACRSGSWEAAYDGLTRATRDALAHRARPIGALGVDLLRPLPTDADESLRRLHLGDALAHFALADAQTFDIEAEVWPVAERYDGRRLEASVIVTGTGGATRKVVVAFEDAGWRLHAPTMPPLSTGESAP